MYAIPDDKKKGTNPTTKKKATIKELATDSNDKDHEIASDLKNDTVLFYHIMCNILRFSMYDVHGVSFELFRRRTDRGKPSSGDVTDIRSAKINNLKGLFDSGTPEVFPDSEEEEEDSVARSEL